MNHDHYMGIRSDPDHCLDCCDERDAAKDAEISRLKGEVEAAQKKLSGYEGILCQSGVNLNLRRLENGEDIIVPERFIDFLGKFILLQEEHERCRKALELLYKAVHDKGAHPEAHDEILDWTKLHWPTLWKALDGCFEALAREGREG